MLQHTRQLAALLLGCSIFAAPIAADARPVVALHLDGSLVVATAHGIKLVPLLHGLVHTGDRVRYIITAKNSGDQPALKLTPAAVVPPGTQLVAVDAGSASSVEISRDHGRSWLPLTPLLRAKATNLRWKFTTPVAPNSGVAVSLRCEGALMLRQLESLTNSGTMKLLRILILITGVAMLVQLGSMRPSAAAATPAGTQISNTVNATYVDSSTTSYSTNSNTVVTVVQNAPSFTTATSAPITTVPGTTITDSFTLTNTGNNGAGYPGHFQVDVGPTISLGGASVTGYTYTYNGATSGSYATVAALNTALNAATNVVNITATGATAFVIINVTYTIPTSAAAGAFTDTLPVNLTYPGGGAGMTAWAASTTADSSPVVTNNVVTDARMDLQLAQSQNAGTGVITYTLTANNGGSTGTKDLASAQALIPGPAANGTIITDMIPQFGGSPLTLSTTVTVATSAGNGYNAAHYRIYYTTNATGAAGWTAAGAADAAGTIPAGATYIAVYTYGGAGGVEFSGHAAGSTPTTVTAAAMTITFAINPPTGAGSANAGAITNMGNAMWGDNQTTEHILGPGIPTATADSASAAQLDAAAQGINNTSAPPGSGYTNGYSNALTGSGARYHRHRDGPVLHRRHDRGNRQL